MLDCLWIFQSFFNLQAIYKDELYIRILIWLFIIHFEIQTYFLLCGVLDKCEWIYVALVLLKADHFLDLG